MNAILSKLLIFESKYLQSGLFLNSIQQVTLSNRHHLKQPHPKRFTPCFTHLIR